VRFERLDSERQLYLKRPSSSCKFFHDLKECLASKPKDLVVAVPGQESRQEPCPLFVSLGICPFGFKCRHLSSHVRQLEEGEGFQGAGVELVYDLDKAREARRKVNPKGQDDEAVEQLSYDQLLRWVTETRGELNVVTAGMQKALRSQKVC
jgi:hypothetical protein